MPPQKMQTLVVNAKILAILDKNAYNIAIASAVAILLYRKYYVVLKRES